MVGTRFRRGGVKGKGQTRRRDDCLLHRDGPATLHRVDVDRHDADIIGHVADRVTTANHAVDHWQCCSETSKAEQARRLSGETSRVF